MTSPKLSPAQKFYSSYFPELLKEPHDKKIYEVNSPFILNDTGKNLEIDNVGMFICNKTDKKGFPAHFYQMVEGMPKAYDMDYFNLVSVGGFLPGMSDIQNYSQNLFNSNNSPVLDYIKNRRGLIDATIKEYQIGYDDTSNRIVFPIINATDCGVTAVKYFAFPINKASNKNSVMGFPRLLDYHKLYLNTKNVKKFLFVSDVIDALYLKQLGYDVLCCVSEDEIWFPEWNKLIKDKEILLLTDNDEEAIHWINQIKRKRGKFLKVSLNGSISDFFIKNKKSPQDFEDVISKSKLIDEKFIKDYKLIKTAKASASKKYKLNVAQDFVNDNMYFGVNIEDELNIISSGPERIEPDDLPAKGLELNYSETDESGFSIDGVDKYLLQSYQVDPFEVFNKIKDYLKKYVFIDNQNVFDMLSVWIMGTYIFRVFRHYPYIHIQADKGSGKSFLFEIIEPLCFNGEIYIHPTSSTLFRDVDRNSRTLLLDEIEDYKKSNKPGFNDLMGILHSGYAKSGDVPRAKSGKKGGIVKYKTYSPKMFAGISDIGDTLDSRTIKIQMKRKLPEDKVVRYRDNAAMLEFHQSLKDDLYIFALQYASQVNDKYSDGSYSSSFLDRFDSRRSDLWAPLFLITDVIESTSNLQSPTISESLFEYSKLEDRYHKVLDAESNEQNQLVESLNTILKQAKYKKSEEVEGENILYYLTDDILQLYKSLPDNRRKKITKNMLSRALSKLGIEVKNTTGNEKCYIINLNSLEDYANRYDIEFSTEGIIRKKSVSEGLFIPQRLIITEKSKNAQRTAEIIDRVKKINDKVEILNSDQEDPKLPISLGLTEQYEYVKETLVLATRSAKFADCFPSPGNIVEGMTTTTNLGFQCNSNCEYCYLQDAGRQEIPWRKVYVNLETMEDEIQKEYLVFRFANTLWCALSFYLEKTLPKIPEGFKEIVNDFRNKVLSKSSTIDSDASVKNYLKESLADHFLRLEGHINDKDKLDAIKKKIVEYYNENMKMKLWLTISEYYDLVRVNHITKNLDYLMNLINSNKELRISISTKSAGIKDLQNYSGDNRVKFTMGFNTDEMITKYEHNTSSLDERFEAFSNLQKAKGYILRPSIEPIIAYPGFEDDYKLLAQRMINELDLGASNVDKIKFGCLRIGPQLRPKIESNYSDTELFSSNQMLYPPVPPDTKYRYSEDVRLKIYEILLSEFGQFRPKLALACEYPTIWAKLHLSFKDHLKTSIYQYPG